MSASTDFDAWATELGLALGMRVTRDPDLIHPPCVFIDTPSIEGRTLHATRYTVPVFLVAMGVGRQAGDYLLDNGDKFLAAISEASADPRVLTIGDIPYPTLHVSKKITISREH